MRAFGVPPGLGSHAEPRLRLDARLAGAMLVDPGDEGRRDRRRDSQRRAAAARSVHDEIHYDDERGFYRETDRAGGLEGGMTNGET